MVWAISCLLWLAAGTARGATPCGWWYVSLSELAPQRFEALAAESRSAFPGTGYDWFVGGPRPALGVTEGNAGEVAAVVKCCGLGAPAMEALLLGLLGDRASAEIPVSALYERAFRLALERSGATDPLCYDCMATAMTFVDARLFARFDDGADVRFDYHGEIFGRRYGPLPEGAPLRWGDLVRVERNGRPVHVMIYLADGLALHKLGGEGPDGEPTSITIEPVVQGREFYRDFYARNYPGEPNDIAVSLWRTRQAASP